MDEERDEKVDEPNAKIDATITVLRWQTSELEKLKGKVRELRSEVRELRGKVRENADLSERVYDLEERIKNPRPVSTLSSPNLKLIS